MAAPTSEKLTSKLVVTGFLGGEYADFAYYLARALGRNVLDTFWGTNAEELTSKGARGVRDAELTMLEKSLSHQKAGGLVAILRANTFVTGNAQELIGQNGALSVFVRTPPQRCLDKAQEQAQQKPNQWTAGILRLADNDLGTFSSIETDTAAAAFATVTLDTFEYNPEQQVHLTIAALGEIAATHQTLRATAQA